MAADPPMTSDVQAARELDRECEDAHDGLHAVYLRARADAVAAWDDVQVQMSDLSGTLALVMTLRAKLTAAEERAATTERERDEARALAAERLRLAVSAVIPMEALRMCGQGYLSDAVWRGVLESTDAVRAAALTSGADHGG